jgi:hypothetical protein
LKTTIKNSGQTQDVLCCCIGVAAAPSLAAAAQLSAEARCSNTNITQLRLLLHQRLLLLLQHPCCSAWQLLLQVAQPVEVQQLHTCCTLHQLLLQQQVQKYQHAWLLLQLTAADLERCPPCLIMCRQALCPASTAGAAAAAAAPSSCNTQMHLLQLTAAVIKPCPDY